MNDNAKSLYESCAAVAALNSVEGFDPRRCMRVTETEDGPGLYLDVKFRKLWFRLKHPEGKIKKIFHILNEQVAICEARVYLSKDDSEEQYVGSGVAQRMFVAGDKFGEKYVENAETAAIGRALAEAGFGTQFSDCDPTEPPDATVVDSPIPVSSQPRPVTTAKPAEHAPKAAPMPEPKPEGPLTAEQYYAAMTLDKAKAVVIDCGCYKGKTLGQLALTKPGSLTRYVESYKGPNNLLRAAARYLLDRAANG